LVVSFVCLLLIGGPIANALFESPLEAPGQAATVATATNYPLASPLTYKVGWIIFGALLTVGFVLTVSRRSRPA